MELGTTMKQLVVRARPPDYKSRVLTTWPNYLQWKRRWWWCWFYFNRQLQLPQVIPEQYVTRINITPITVVLHNQMMHGALMTTTKITATSFSSWDYKERNFQMNLPSAPPPRTWWQQWYSPQELFRSAWSARNQTDYETASLCRIDK